jgi:hypothetical protein
MWAGGVPVGWFTFRIRAKTGLPQLIICASADRMENLAGVPWIVWPRANDVDPNKPKQGVIYGNQFIQDQRFACLG